jgi:hypothetical protein
MPGYRYKISVISIAAFLFLFIYNTCKAQQKDTLIKNNSATTTSVTGSIIDAATGKPLPYVSIGFTGSSYGTRSEMQGKYTLTAAGSFKQVSITSVGYQSIVKVIQVGQSNTLNVRLQPAQSQLKEVKVSSSKSPRYHNKGNPAVELIRQVIDHKSQNQMESVDYLQYDQYERVAFSLFNLSPKFVNGHFFSKYKFMLDSSQVINGKPQTALPVFFSEKNYQYFYQKNPEKSINILQAQKEVNILKFIDTVGLDIYLNRLYGNKINIYDNNIFIVTNQFLSPVADHAPDFYKFFITDTLQDGQEKLVELSFTPRNKGDLLFEGKLLVTLDGHYSVKSCDLNVNKQININFMRTLNVRQDFTRYQDGHYYLAKSTVRADFGILKSKGIGIFGERTVFYKNYRLHEPQPLSFYDGKTEQMAPHATQTDTAYWSHHRVDTLPQQEANIYSKVLRLESMPSFKRTTWIASTIAGGYGDVGPVQIGPFDSFYSFNNIEGSRFRLGARTTPVFNQNVYLEGYGAYGTYDKQFKYYMGASYSFNKLPYYQYPNNYLKVSYQYDTDIPGQNFLIEKAQSILLSIRRGSNDLWLYNRIFRLDYIKDFENHFSFDLGFKRWQQQPAGTLYYQLNQSQFTNIPELTTSSMSLGLRYAPHEQILQGTMFRHTIPSKYPIFNLKVDQAFNGLLNGSYAFTNVSSSIYKRFYLSQLGYTDVTLQGGILLGKVPFPLLNILPANQTYLYDENAYNMMNFLEFVSDHYVGLNLTHNFNGFLLNKVPLVEHLKLREFLSLKILYGGLRNENNPFYSSGLYKFPTTSNGIAQTYSLGNTPYTEAGFGIGNIFKFLRVDAIRRFNYLNHPGVTPYGLRFSFSPQL